MFQPSFPDLRTATAAVVLAGCLFTGPASAQEVYKWVDEEGVTHFGHAATSPKHKLAEAQAGPSANRAAVDARISNAAPVEQHRAELTLARRNPRVTR